MRNFLFTLFALLCSIAAVFSQELDEDVLKMWWQKDLELDSIPGIGLQRTYNELIKDKRGKEVVVAVLDTKIDMFHEDFRGIFWVNQDEIPFNGIDDDNNGYVDDTNGWNFLGNKKNEDLSGQLSAPARIVKQLKNKYEGLSKRNINKNEIESFNQYLKAKEYVDYELKDLKEFVRRTDSVNALYYGAKDSINYFIENKNYSYKEVDSLILEFPEMKSYFETLSLALYYGITEKDLEEQQNYFKRAFVSLDYSMDSREQIGDDPTDLSDAYYGNPILINNDLEFQHSTGVTGLVAAKRNNDIGIDGFAKNIKIMPVVMVADGDENDKDVALGIRYAVDNGAQIINMSWGKYFSSNSGWVKDAILYAEEKNVLLVTASGNDAKDIDEEPYFPHDEIEGEEYVDNFIFVGGIRPKVDSTFVASFSNYGKRMVDILAPSEDIFTTEVKSTYRTSSGTSYASPMVAGTAALLKSYFPELTAIQLKEIILNSGTKLDIMVKRPGDDDDAPLVPFSSLSKTGSILNTYAAFKYAMELKN